MSLSGRRILIVEDEALICLDLEEELSQAGADSSVVCDFRGAVEALEGLSAFDAAVIDYAVSDESSQQLVGLLTALRLPFVIHTGYPVSELRLGPVVAKPAEKGAVVRALEKVLAC